jgi:sulfofructose kinase
MPAVSAIDILGLGVVAVDDLLYVDEYPAAEQKVRVRRRLRQCGGLTGTALVAAARLGARCAYGGMLGTDDLSQFVVDGFTREGIDVGPAVRRVDARPAHSTIVVDETHKTRTIFASLEGIAGPDLTLPEAQVICASRVLLVDHHGLEGTIRAARIARQEGIGVVADLERNPGGPFAVLLELVDHLVVSQRFAQQLSGESDVVRATARLWHAGRQAVVVTCGVAGCWYIDAASANRPQHLPAFNVAAVDTTGCGDVFHGAYAAALAQGKGLTQRVILASAAAALKATRRGGQAGSPTAAEVAAFLADRGMVLHD